MRRFMNADSRTIDDSTTAEIDATRADADGTRCLLHASDQVHVVNVGMAKDAASNRSGLDRQSSAIAMAV
ncbi:MAG: hypothetical protein AAGK09_04510 [Planctomycetota bacterium]